MFKEDGHGRGDVAGRRAERLRARVFTPFVLILVTLLVMALTATYWLSWRSVDRLVGDKIEGTERLLARHLDESTQRGTALVEHLQNDETLREALRAHNRDELSAAALSEIEEFKKQHDVTGLCLMDAEGAHIVCLIEPEQKHDAAQSEAIGRVVAQRTPVCGLTVQNDGTMAFQLVAPWSDQDGGQNYLQMSQTFERLTPELGVAQGLEVFFLVRKDYLDKNRWEEGRRALDQWTLWDDFAEFALVDYSVLGITAQLREHVRTLLAGSGNRIFGLNGGERIYRGGTMPVVDAAERPVGEIALLADVTEAESYARELAVLWTFVFVAFGALGFTLYFIYVGRLQRGVVDDVFALRSEIAERRRIEEVLRLTRFAVENAPDCIFWANEEGRLVFANRRACDLLCYSQDDMLGLSLFDIDDNLLEADWPGFWSRLKQLRAETVETRFRPADGEVIPVEMTFYRMEYNGQDYLCAFARDISARQQAEERKRALADQLRKAEKMEALGVLAGGVAHDLNNMMGPLVAYPDLILKDVPDGSPAQKMIQQIRKAARGATEIVQDLLSLARSGRYELKPANLNSAVEEYLESAHFRALAKAHPRVKVQTRLDADLSLVRGSASHLKQVVQNIVVNALDAMPTGGTLTIQTYPARLSELMGGFHQISAGDYVVLSVADTGIGIPPEDFSRVFDPYFSRKTMGKSGTGLGLAIVYGIVKDHHGYYDVFSKPGKGTEFLFYFPVTDATQPIRIIDTGGWETNGGKLLVVEDSADQRDLLRNVLTGLGYQVDVTDNGERAVEKVCENEYDVLVIDMIMPGSLDGLDTYREVLRVQPGQQAIIVSGYAATDRVREMQKLGAGAFVRKPFTVEGIQKALAAEFSKKADMTAAF